MSKPATIIVRDVYLTQVMHAIETARLRLLGMPTRNPKEVVAYASVVIEEMGNIIEAKKAYDEAADRAARASLTERADVH